MSSRGNRRRDYMMRYQKSHPLILKKAKQKYRDSNKQKTSVYNRKYKQTHREKTREHSRKRRCLKLKIVGSHSIGEWELLKKQYGATCPCCGRAEPEIVLTLDHIIPLTKGGSDYIENIQPLCKSCNSKKKNRIIAKYPTVFGPVKN